MERETHKVIILPARFLEIVNEEKIKVKIMLEGGDIKERTMAKILTDSIENPDYLFVGISVGINNIQLDVCDANEFNEIFKEKWSEL